METSALELKNLIETNELVYRKTFVHMFSLLPLATSRALCVREKPPFWIGYYRTFFQLQNGDIAVLLSAIRTRYIANEEVFVLQCAYTGRNLRRPPS